MDDKNGKPIALVVGDKNFLGYYLSELLSRQGCKVITKEETSVVDYIFCLDDSNKGKIDKLLNLAEKIRAKFLLATSKDNYQHLFPKNIDLRIVRLGKIYGPRMSRAEFEKLEQVVDVFAPKPVFISDVVYGLVKAMFASGTRGKIFSLIGKNEELGWEPQVEFAQGIEQTRKWFGKENEGGKLEVGQKSKFSHFTLLILLFIIILFYPFASLGFQSFWGVRNLKKAQQAALTADFNQVIKSAGVAKSSFAAAKAKISQLSFLFKIIGFEQVIFQNEKLFDSAQKAAEGLVDLGVAAEKTSQLLGFALQNQPLDVNQSIREIKLELDQAYEKLSLVEPGVEDQKLHRQIVEIKNLVSQARNGVLLIPEIIGLNKRQVYLVLFQNNMELRPTGGFIGSFALITFDKGRLVDFEVQDVYWADGQLKGHIEPPIELKKYLGEAGWYLRDSNWDPDFPTSAARAAWFLEKETGRTVDGVMGINLNTALGLLEAIGEIQLPDFQEKITPQNLFERAEYYSEISFFPGSTQKQDFLGSLARAMFEKIKNADQKTWLSLAKAVYQSVRQKDIFIYLKNPEAMEIIKGLNWDGALRQGFDGELSRTAQCKEKKVGCLEDYLMVVEANVGVNKANFFLKRNFAHQVRINQDGLVEETLRLDYQNTSPSEAFPGGKYKNYLRVYVPSKSELIKVVVKNPQTGRGEEMGSERWEIREEHGKQVFGFLLEVPPQESRTVEVVYQLPEKISGESVQYLLILQKQSGIKDESFNLWFEKPPKMTIVSTKPQASSAGGGIVFYPKFDNDLVFEIGLTHSTSLKVNPEPAEGLTK